MKKAMNYFFTSISFFTRIPVARWADFSERGMAMSLLFFPIVGWLVGGLVALCFGVIAAYIPIFPALVISTLFGILITGAFHEDGLADVCDGFGGGYTKQRVLQIMKDSQIGTYGTIGIVMTLLLKIALLASIPFQHIPLSILAAHSLSRALPVWVTRFLPYARLDDKNSKSATIAHKHNIPFYLFTSITGIAPLFLMSDTKLFLLIPILAILLIAAINRFRKHIQGYTGDCLGALQQISELVCYSFFVIIYGCF